MVCDYTLKTLEENIAISGDLKLSILSCKNNTDFVGGGVSVIITLFVSVQ